MLAVTTDFSIAEVIGQYEDDVRFLRGKRQPGAKERCSAQEDRSKRDEHSPAEFERAIPRTKHDSTVSRNSSLVQTAHGRFLLPRLETQTMLLYQPALTKRASYMVLPLLGHLINTLALERAADQRPSGNRN